MPRHTSVQRLEYIVIENSSVGLVMVRSEVTVTVTREEHHQAALARYPVATGAQRRVAVELGWCTIGSGKHRGQQAIEVRLDGQRVGELTHLMSQRYAPMVTQVTSQGGRPGCEALIQRGDKGLQVVLLLPRDAESAPIPLPATASSPPQRGAFLSQRPGWIAVAVVVVVFFVALAINNDDSRSTTPAAQLGATTTTATASTTVSTTTRTTEAQPTTTTVTTTTAAPVAAPATSQPAPKKTTTKQADPTTTEAKPKPGCDPNYTGCVPVATDVDCLGGSGNGPAYVKGPVRVIGTDIYDLDRDGDGVACE